jgi:hypothetical protein
LGGPATSLLAGLSDYSLRSPLRTLDAPELIEGAESSSPAKSPRKVECSVGTAGLSGLQSVAATGLPSSSPHPVTTDGSEVDPSVVITPIVIHDEEQNDSDGVFPAKTDDDTTRNPFINDDESIVDGQSQMQSFAEEEGYDCDHDSRQHRGNVIVCHD